MGKYGYELEKILPDGRVTGIAKTSYGKGQIIIGDSYGVDGSW